MAISSADKVSSKCRRQALANVGPDRAMRILALAEISAQHLAEIEDELNAKRAVEAVFVADLGDLLRCRIVAGEGRRGIGRHHPHHQKGHDQQPEQRRDGIRSTAQDEAQQAVVLR